MSKKSNLVKKIVSLGIISAISVSTFGIGVASAAFKTNVSVGGGTWHYSTGLAYAESDYMHSKNTHSSSVKAGKSGKVYTSVATKNIMSAVNKNYFWGDLFQTKYVYWNNDAEG